MAIFGPIPWVNPFGKMQVFDFLNFLFLQPRKAFCRSRIGKRHFPGLYCLKEKSWNNVHFQTNSIYQIPWKNVNFLTYCTFCFYSLVRRFFVVEYRKRHFLGLCCLKKKLEKWPFLDQSHGKCQFYDFLNLLFLRPREVSFRSRIS